MEKVIFALVTAVLLHSPMAKAEYIGTFTAGSFYSFEIAAGGSDEWAVTFMSVVRGRLQVDNMIAGNGNLPPTNIHVPAHADRVILLVDTNEYPHSVLIRVISGGVFQEVLAQQHARLVADVVP
jgi:hypothetical protein